MTYLWIPQICAMIIQSGMHLNVLSLWSLVTGNLHKITKFLLQFHAERKRTDPYFVCDLHLALDRYFLWIMMTCTNIEVVRVHKFVLPFCRVVVVLLILRYSTETKSQKIQYNNFIYISMSNVMFVSYAIIY